MTYVIGNTNHPCYPKDCKDCEICIFDEDLFKDKKMKNKELCNNCESLLKHYVQKNDIQFNAACGKSFILFDRTERPRNIKYKVGPMLDIEAPYWCPKKKGVTKEYADYDSILKEDKEHEESMAEHKESPATPPKKEEKKVLTYYEKKELLMKLPRRVEWDDIEEGEVYVIPKLLYQSRKVVRIVIKTESLIRCSEIDEFGKENQICTSIYPKDIESIFLTKLHKY